LSNTPIHCTEAKNNVGLAVRTTKKKVTLFLEQVLKYIKYIPVYKEI
jgi:hypothetical protein